MSSWTNNTKSGVSSASNTTKSSGAWLNHNKSGYAWKYNESGYTYDAEADPLTGAPINYDSVGTLPTWTNQSKN